MTKVRKDNFRLLCSSEVPRNKEKVSKDLPLKNETHSLITVVALAIDGANANVRML
jgi:hypothetical protein